MQKSSLSPFSIYIIAMAMALSPAGAELPRQVMIDMKVVETTYDSSKELGVEWGFMRDDTSGATVRSATFPFSIEREEEGVMIRLDRIGISEGAFEAKLQALIEKGDAELLSNPQIVVIDGQAATITTGERIPVQSTQVAGSQVILFIDFKDAGVTLKVTPTIMEEEYIYLKIDATVNNVIRTETVLLADGTSAELPVFSTRQAVTPILVRNGETFRIGGLYQYSKKKRTKGVPVLSKIPILGFLFRSSKDSLIKTEVIFFITPHIVLPGEKLILPRPRREIEEEKE